MKKIKIQNIILYVINFILIGFIIFSNKGIILDNNRIILKNMNETTQVNDLNKLIEKLNNSHTEYASYIETSKANLATAITREGVETSSDSTIEVMIENIEKIVNTKTVATATEEDIIEGKTAWVNGNKIVGTMEIKQGKQVVYLGTATSFDLTSYDNYTEFTTDNFIVCATDASYTFQDSWHYGHAYVRKNVSWDVSTGILTAYESLQWRYNHYTGDPTRTGSGNYPVAVYLIY